MSFQGKQSLDQLWAGVMRHIDIARGKTALLTVFTLSILLFGTLSIFHLLDGRALLAAQLVILSAALDGIDGTIARSLKAESRFGAQLDTYVDTVCFAVAPAMLAALSLCPGQWPWGALTAFAIIAAGVLRFARGCELPSPAGHGFRGLPIPVGAVWIALFVCLVESGISRQLPDAAGSALAVFMWIITGTMLVLQLSNVQYAKLKRQQLALGLACAAVIAIVTGRPLLALGSATGIACLLYALGSPLAERLQAHAGRRKSVTVG